MKKHQFRHLLPWRRKTPPQLTPPKLTESVSDIIALDDFALCDHIWSLVSNGYHAQTDIWSKDFSKEVSKCDYPESLWAMQLPEHWWTAYAVHAFEYDELAGGICQFLDNHNGLTNERTAAAFCTIGHPGLADAFLVVGNAYLAFRKDQCPSYRGLSEKEYGEVILARDNALREAYKQFSQIHDNIDVRASLAKYIRANITLFTK